MKKRGLIIGLLIMLALVTSGFTYAFWAGSITGGNQDVAGTVTIGEGGNTTVTVTAPALSEVDLVPETVNAANSYVVLTFPVAWTENVADTASASGLLNAALVTNSFVIFVFNGTDWVNSGLTHVEIDAMFDVVVTANGTNAAISVDGAAVNVEVTVTFKNEPADQATYDLVAKGRFTFDINFQVDYNA
ncbi:MAG: hypothetical protein CVV61_02715 [Tenericutes bacterium HGW-Tenericutes-6]|nr:MAG: hypothetical protein CVV61_02715 [Tenericutes bacterium HGW-Tenericutes-6]